jgi:hypothetical protein
MEMGARECLTKGRRARELYSERHSAKESGSIRRRMRRRRRQYHEQQTWRGGAMPASGRRCASLVCALLSGEGALTVCFSRCTRYLTRRLKPFRISEEHLARVYKAPCQQQQTAVEYDQAPASRPNLRGHVAIIRAVLLCTGASLTRVMH